jgi:succinate dehydrogenase / fumarate reductase iron-sulfur subunit
MISFKIARKYIKPILKESLFFRKILKTEKHFLELPENADKEKTLPVLVERFNEASLTADTDYTSVYWIDFSKDIGPSVIDLLNFIRENIDSSLAFRQNCRDGSCGICSMNINGRNTLACIAPTTPSCQMTIKPLTGYRVVHDLVVDISDLYTSLEQVQPWLISNKPLKSLQTKEPQPNPIQPSESLKKTLRCNLCGSCNASNPNFWWSREKYLGPSVLLQAYRWIIEPKDTSKNVRILNLLDQDQDSIFKSDYSEGSCPLGLETDKILKDLQKEMKTLKNNWNDWSN